MPKLYGAFARIKKTKTGVNVTKLYLSKNAIDTISQYDTDIIVELVELATPTPQGNTHLVYAKSKYDEVKS